ncbi:MAG: sodium:proton antiporter NhaD [Rikenellaceae bacterium]
MIILVVVLFLLGYIAIAFEHQLKVNKAGVALVMGVLLWTCYALFMPEAAAEHNPNAFADFLRHNPSAASLPYVEQCLKFIVSSQVVESLGEISETLFFLIGAMTIVEVVDVHGGFAFVTNRITTGNKTKLLWIISLSTFFLSAILDNMTTAIVMVMLIRRLIPNYKERWLFAATIILAANSGGAWSPIGDITTIMLWVKGNITASSIVTSIFIPSLIACIVPTFIASRLLHGVLKKNAVAGDSNPNSIIKLMPRGERLSITVLGIMGLVSVPFFKSFTHLPPFMGILLVLGILWIYTEITYTREKGIKEVYQQRVPRVLRHIDTPTVLFFLGILLAVDALKGMGILESVAMFLDSEVHNIYASNIIIGLLSSIVDNVPLVAASIGMYPMADPSAVEVGSYAAAFVQDGTFWHFIAYCAGVGGSVLIIGSVSGVVVMGIEKISFGWYVKNVSLMALCGYLAGAAYFILVRAF